MSGSVYRPRRGGVGCGLAHFSAEQRRQVLAAAGAEMCIFKYEIDETSPTLGRPLDGPPHAIYLDAGAGAGGRGAGPPRSVEQCLCAALAPCALARGRR